MIKIWFYTEYTLLWKNPVRSLYLVIFMKRLKALTVGKESTSKLFIWFVQIFEQMNDIRQLAFLRIHSVF